MATNTNITINDVPHRAMDVNLTGATTSDGTIQNIGIVGVQWDSQVTAKGTVGVNLDVTPLTTGNIHEMIISAPGATDAATLAIYTDSVSGSTQIFDGYIRNLDGDNSIKWPAGEAYSTKLIVVITGGSGSVYALARYR